MSNRLEPLTEPFSDEIAQALENYPRIDGYLLTLFRTFANSLRFLTKGVPNLLDRESPLPLRIREIVILRVTASLDCEYEWGVHVAVFAKAAKFSDDQIAATRAGAPANHLWSSKEARLIEAIDQLCASGSMTAATLETFESDWTAEQQLEIMALCGTYHTISFVANCAGLANEKFAPRFPS